MRPPTLSAKRMGVDTYRQPMVYLRADSIVCRSEGFEALTRVSVRGPTRTLVATLNVVTSNLLSPGEAGFSEETWRRMDVEEGTPVRIAHAPPVSSLGHLRAKIYGRRLDFDAIDAIVRDLRDGLYSDIHVAAFLTACGGDRLNIDEIVALTRSMVRAGERLSWSRHPVVDKHCIGGLPGNRTTPLIVSIAAAAGLTMPKTSSRAITSPAGTADVMATMTPVDLSLNDIRRIVHAQGGCLAWGGAVQLSPVDDILIRVERTLDVDGPGQLIASVLSKKIAAGSSHVLIDIPWGPTAKVRSESDALHLARDMETVGRALGLEVATLLTDGSQPVGAGIGPALEARDVLSVLRREPDAPEDLRERALILAAKILELGGAAPPERGVALAARLLDDGSAWERFLAICEAQGGFREPPKALLTRPFHSPSDGVVASIDNRRLARIAKLAGAPADPASGLVLHVHVGDPVTRGQPLFTIHSDSPGERDYALAYLKNQPDIVRITPGSTFG